MKTSPAKPALLTLEQLLARLEQVVEQLRSGDYDSTASLKLFYEGNALIRQGRQTVIAAEKCINKQFLETSKAWYVGYLKFRLKRKRDLRSLGRGGRPRKAGQQPMSDILQRPAAV